MTDPEFVLQTIDTLDDEEEKESLRSILRERGRKAIRALVTGEVDPKDFQYEKVPQRPVRGSKGKEFDYVPGWWFIEKLNALFLHHWDFEVVREDISKDFAWVLGKLTVYLPDGAVITKMQYGGSAIKKTTEGKVIDIGDDLKAAATDAFKKCSTALGLAAKIYGQRELETDTTISASVLTGILSVALKLGGTEEELRVWVKQETGVEFEALTKDLGLQVLVQLRKLEQTKQKFPGQANQS